MTEENDGNNAEEIENLLQKLDKRLENGEISKATYNKAAERLKQKLKEKKKTGKEAKTTDEERVAKEKTKTDSKKPFLKRKKPPLIVIGIMIILFIVIMAYSSSTNPEPLTGFNSHREDEVGDVLIEGVDKAPTYTDITEASVYEEEDFMHVNIDLRGEIPDKFTLNEEYLLMVRIKTSELNYTFNWGVSFGEKISDIFDREELEYMEKNWSYSKQDSFLHLQIPLNTINNPTEFIKWQIICGYSEKPPNKVTAMDWLPDNEFITAAKAE